MSGISGADTGPSNAPRDEVRAIWFSYLDFNTLLKNKTKSEFTRNLNRAFGTIEGDGFNTVFVQVRPFGDALYKSAYFPWSHTITGTEGEDPGFDPLEVIIDTARQYGLRVEAWINPYRIRNSGTKAAMDEDSLGYYWWDEGTGEVIEYGGGIYYNPANEFAREHIVNGVSEIVSKYAVHGIHFDDYFYPTTDAAFDKEDYAQYKSDGGKLSLANWRRENVNKLVKAVYTEIKRIDKGVEFGISPQGNNDINYNEQYIDVEKWATTAGYVDYICPQIYFGFDNDTCPFSETVAYWNRLITRSDVALYVGMSASKIGLEDRWAGSGSDEWQSSTNMLQRMVTQSRRSSRYQGFAMFRYSSLYAPDSAVKTQVDKEKANLKTLLK